MIRILFLLVLGIIIVCKPITIGDGCVGTGIADYFIWIILILIYVTLLIIDLLKKQNTKKHISLIMTALFVMTGFITFNLEHFKSKVVLRGYLYCEDKDFSSSEITLRDNKSFELKQAHYSHYTCCFKGKYEIKNDTLVFLRDDINDIGDGVMTNRYIIKKNKIIPISDHSIKCDLLYEIDNVQSTKGIINVIAKTY